MIGSVLSRGRQLLSNSVFGSSLAGDGLLVRLRSTSIGLLGIVTAVGLGLIAFIAQLGWPGVFNAPIPGAPHETSAIHGAIALTRPAPRLVSSLPNRASQTRANAASHSRNQPHPSGSNGSSGIGGSRQLGTSGSVQAPVRAAQPPAAPAASDPTGQLVATTPAASPATPPASPAEGSPKSSSSGDSKGDPSAETKSKSHGTASTKTKGESDPSWKSGTFSPTKDDQDPEIKPEAKAYPAPPKQAEYTPSKPVEEEGTDPPKEIAPPATTAPSKDAPEAGAFGKGRDAGYTSESDKRRH